MTNWSHAIEILCSPKAARTYTCGLCGGTFEFAVEWDAHAKAEARATFGTDPDDDPTMEVVCDDCYRLIMREHTDTARKMMN